MAKLPPVSLIPAAILPKVSLIPVVHLDLRLSPRIFEKFRNGPNAILWGWGEADHQKNQKQKISWHCPFKCAWITNLLHIVKRTLQNFQIFFLPLSVVPLLIFCPLMLQGRTRINSWVRFSSRRTPSLLSLKTMVSYGTGFAIVKGSVSRFLNLSFYEIKEQSTVVIPAFMKRIQTIYFLFFFGVFANYHITFVWKNH